MSSEAYEIKKLTAGPASLYLQKSGARRLGILLPGGGYNTAMPLFYYATNMFLDVGADVLHVNYDFFDSAKRADTGFEERLVETCTQAIDAACAERKYDEIAVVGKSLGTWAMSRLFTDADGILANRKRLKGVWLTPLWENEVVFERMLRVRAPSLHVIGTADANYSKERHVKLASIGQPLILALPNADHSLDTARDVDQSVGNLKAALYKTKKFLDEIWVDR